MSLSMSAMTLDMLIPSLKSLGEMLAKAAAFADAKKLEPGTLENARLAPDMYALKRQVQLTCDFAKNSVTRLAGIEGPKFDDKEQTLADLQARVARTVEYLQTIDPKSLQGADTRHIVVPLHTRTLEMNGLPFLQKWVLPNFYFHLTATYAILRHNGVEVGKRDFLGGV